MRPSAWWLRLDAAFHGARRLPPEARASYLAEACGGDGELCAEVQAMLAADAPGHALAVERLVRDADEPRPEADPIIGLRLGPWRVLDLIGRGGMGTVYLAERADGQYAQRVALKIVRSGPQPSAGSAAFAVETGMLARLSHANIARLIDAGHTPEGSPWLVMEHVDGAPITAHCDARRLTIEERLRLVRVVCDATQHAHQSLIVHRDLKPSNIFVSNAGEVKLLDFGIAKLLEPDQPLADQTAPELRALTPAYAAPEQLRGERVTTAADVFVLGVVLHELLTGERHAGEAARAPLDAPVALPAPSIVVGRRMADGDASAQAKLAAIAAARRTSPARLARRLSGDIDRVVLKAVQPAPERRYRSAGELADDIQRLLDGRPVLAQPDTLAYRARRFVARHRVGVAMAMALGILAVAFVAVAALQARAVALERDRAQVEARRAQRVSVLVADLFKLAEPAVGRGETITARELLDGGTHRVASTLHGDPDAQAALFKALARVYGHLGLHAPAIGVLERALPLEPATTGAGGLARAETLHLLAERSAALNDHAAADRRFREALALRRTLGAPGADVAGTLEGLGGALHTAGQYAEARTLLEEAVAIRRNLPEAPAGDLASALHRLGLLVHFQGDPARAQRLFREAIAVSRRIPGPSPEKVASVRRHAEFVAVFERAPARAEPLWREALAMARTIYPGDHQQVATCLGELSLNLLRLERPAEAEPIAREGAAMVRRMYGDRHNETLQADLDLARILRAARKLTEAERLLRAALPQSRSLLGDGNSMTIVTARGLAAVLEDQGRFQDALDLRRDELARTRKVLGDRDVFVATGLAALGQHGLARRRVDLADQYFTQALDLRRAIHPPNHWRIAEARGSLGLARLRAGRLADAEVDLLAAYEGLRVHRGADARETETVRTYLVELYERWNRPDHAGRYRGTTR